MKIRAPLTIVSLLVAGCSSTPDLNSTSNDVTMNQEKSDVRTYTSKRVGYLVPNNITEGIIVTLNIDRNTGLITAVTNQHFAKHHKSERYMQWFDDGVQGVVVGQEIAGLSIAKVNGASDTTYGFNEAVLDIQQQYADHG